jgi:hypothetical protein
MTANHGYVFLRLFAVVWSAIELLGCNRDPVTLDELIARNTKVMGGRVAIEAIQTIEVALHITDPDFEVDSFYHAARPGRMRIDVSAGGKHVFAEAFDGKRGWQREGEGSEQKTATEQATAALRHGIGLPGKLFGLHELKERGHRVELLGRERIDRINYYVLRLTLSDGYNVSLYAHIDQTESRMIDRNVTAALRAIPAVADVTALVSA